MSFPAKLIFENDNTQVFEIGPLRDGLSSVVINDAILTCNLKNRSGAAVPTFPTNLAVEYVAASTGLYRGVVPHTFNTTTGGGYKLHVDGQDANGNYVHIEIAVEVKTRVN